MPPMPYMPYTRDGFGAPMRHSRSHAQPHSRVTAPSAYTGATNEWIPALPGPPMPGSNAIHDAEVLPDMGPVGDPAPQYHWHHDTHHHHYYGAQTSGRGGTSALTASPQLQPALSRSGGCLVTFLVLLGAFLTFMVMLMGLALAGQILALR